MHEDTWFFLTMLGFLLLVVVLIFLVFFMLGGDGEPIELHEVMS